MQQRVILFLCFSFLLLFCVDTVANELDLPDPLVTQDGVEVTTPEQWQETRRPEILELFREHVYGRAPIGRPSDQQFVPADTVPDAMHGTATRKRVDITFSGSGGKGSIRLLLFVPNETPRPVPAFLLICHRDSENIDPTREIKKPFWPAERIVRRGYAAATFQVADVDPDKHDEFQNGVHGIFDPQDRERDPDAWGTICAWAWGAARCLDYLETDADIDAKHVAVIGHSRGGKTALWCGARDQRFAMAISNNSGCTGAAIARRRKGETIKDINRGFPHWFCENYNKYNDNEDKLPVDQHMLVALMAPRPVCVASATRDNWADPKGEFLACVHASPVYELFDLKDPTTTEMPQPNLPLQDGHISYHLRKGGHDLGLYDWDRYMDFADKHWGNTK